MIYHMLSKPTRTIGQVKFYFNYFKNIHHSSITIFYLLSYMPQIASYPNYMLSILVHVYHLHIILKTSFNDIPNTIIPMLSKTLLFPSNLNHQFTSYPKYMYLHISYPNYFHISLIVVWPLLIPIPFQIQPCCVAWQLTQTLSTFCTYQ